MKYQPLIDSLRNLRSYKQPVVLPDFFLDHFVISNSFTDFIEGLESLAKQGGGNLLGSDHLVRRGGNSANTAVALYKLGARPTLIVTTDEQGKKLLQSFIPPDLSLDHIHTDGKLSATVSLELEYQERRVNLMISDSGSAASFGFDDLTEQDLQAIEQSGLVCLLNLNHNEQAVELAKGLFSYVKENTKAITFMDIGDPSGKPEKLEPLVKQVVCNGLVDVLGMNENEAAWYAWALSEKNDDWRDVIRKPDRWISTAEYISSETGVRVDLHTPILSSTIKNNTTSIQPTFESTARILCGAGDAWNAGAIFGLLQELPQNQRLILANAIAALYVSYGTTEHPSLEQVIAYLQSNPSLSIEGTKLLKLN